MGLSAQGCLAVSLQANILNADNLSFTRSARDSSVLLLPARQRSSA